MQPPEVSCNLSMTLNFKFCTSPFWNLSVGSLESKLSNLSRRLQQCNLKGLCSTLPSRSQMQQPTGKAKAAQPESIVRSLLSPSLSVDRIGHQGLHSCRPSTDAAPVSGSFFQASQSCRLYLSCRLTAPMKRPATSSLSFSPDG